MGVLQPPRLALTMRVGPHEIRSPEQLQERGTLPAWSSSGEESEVVQIAVLRLVLRQPVRGERLGGAHLLSSPPQVRIHTMPEPVSPAELAGVLSTLLECGYHVELQPIDRPVSLVEWLVLTGEIEPDPEPVEEAE